GCRAAPPAGGGGGPKGPGNADRRPPGRGAADPVRPGHFRAVVTGDEVDQTKPHPLPYLTAAALLGVDVRRCVAIEDSPTGVASALAAGAAVLAVPAEVDLSTLTGVTLVDSLADVDVGFLTRLVEG